MKFMKNFKILLIFAAFVFAGINANGQAIGFKAGGTFAKINSDPDITADDLATKPGVQFGVIASMAFFPMMDFQPEVIVYQNGVKYKDDNYTNQINFYNINVPLNIRIKPPVLPVYVVAGPYIGYALQGDYMYELTSGGNSFTSEGEIDFERDKYSKFDFGLNGGIGFIKDFGPLHFFIEGRYNLGILDISTSENIVSKHSDIGIAAGILLGFK